MLAPNLSILVLAAGASSRMGKPKQLLPVGDSNLLSHALEQALNAKVTSVYCVLGANADKIYPGLNDLVVEICINENWQNGLGSSISAGVHAILKKEKDLDGILILLGDQPEVDTKYINTLIAQHIKNPNAIIASDYDGFYGVPALFDKSHFDILKTLEGDSGAKELLNSNTAVIGTKGKNKLSDIDTLADYEQYLKTLE